LLAYESPDRCDRVGQTGHNRIGALPNAGMTNWKPESDESIREWLLKVTRGRSDIDAEALIAERLQKAHEPGQVAYPVAEQAHQLTPGSELVILECGHNVPFDDPAGFDSAVLAFLRK
jgi:pimeloyl-ACP methyl ester carboxylesterase